jgi:hypothetical protein
MNLATCLTHAVLKQKKLCNQHASTETGMYCNLVVLAVKMLLVLVVMYCYLVPLVTVKMLGVLVVINSNLVLSVAVKMLGVLVLVYCNVVLLIAVKMLGMLVVMVLVVVMIRMMRLRTDHYAVLKHCNMSNRNK